MKRENLPKAGELDQAIKEIEIKLEWLDGEDDTVSFDSDIEILLQKAHSARAVGVFEVNRVAVLALIKQQLLAEKEELGAELRLL